MLFGAFAAERQVVRRATHSHSSHFMRIVSYVAGALCCLMGGVWFLQGINVLPGSFMTGQTKWAVYGALLLLVGVSLLVAGKRRRA